MYNETDIQGASGLARRWALVCALVGLLLIGTLVIGLVLHSRLIATFLTAAVAMLLYFVIDMALLPRVRYARHLKDIGEGLSRDAAVELKSISESPRALNGIVVYDVICRVGPEPEDERLFYFDAQKPLPNVAPGESLLITSFGSYITALQKAEKRRQ